jgi:hypothetical protein
MPYWGWTWKREAGLDAPAELGFLEIGRDETCQRATPFVGDEGDQDKKALYALYPLEDRADTWPDSSTNQPAKRVYLG